MDPFNKAVHFTVLENEYLNIVERLRGPCTQNIYHLEHFLRIQIIYIISYRYAQICGMKDTFIYMHQQINRILSNNDPYNL